MTTRDDQMLADRVRFLADRLELEARAADTLRSTDIDGNTIRTIRADIADGIAPAGTVDRVLEARRTLDLPDVADDDNVADGMDDWRMTNDALEVRREGFDYGEGWIVERVRVCVGLGGPNLYVFTDGDRAWIDGYWGGSRFTDYPVASIVADLLASELDYLLND